MPSSPEKSSAQGTFM